MSDRRDEIRAKARALLTQHHSRMSAALSRRVEAEHFFPVHPEVIVSDVLGWTFEGVAMLEPTAACEGVRGHCDFPNRTIRVAVDLLRTQGERNFTVAHEIGHAILHSTLRSSEAHLNRPHSMRYRRDPKTHLEVEANRFAADLLMPERAVRRRFEEIFKTTAVWSGASVLAKTGGTRPPKRGRGPKEQIVEASLQAATHQQEDGLTDRRSLCEFFGVSKEAMAVRLRELGLIYSGG